MTTGTDQQTMPVGIIGFGWMGRVHAQAYRGSPITIRRSAHYLTLLRSPTTRRAGRRGRRQFGARPRTREWRDCRRRSGIGRSASPRPNFLHREIGTAVADAGKHLWIEKPVGLGVPMRRRSPRGARRRRAGRLSASITAMRRRSSRPQPDRRRRDRRGDERAVRLLSRLRRSSDRRADVAIPAGPGRQRGARRPGVARRRPGAVPARRDRVGGGGHGDRSSRQRPGVRPAATVGHQPAAAASATRWRTRTMSSPDPVRVGRRCSFEASRVTVGDQNAYGFDMHGTGRRRLGFPPDGRVARRHRRRVPRPAGHDPVRRPVTATTPTSNRRCDRDGIRRTEGDRGGEFLQSIESGSPVGATIWDAVATAQVIEAIAESVRSGSWQRPHAAD